MDSILLNIEQDGKSHDVEVNFVSFAYTYRFQILINDKEIYFEPDEERNLRAIVPPGIILNRQQIELLTLIGRELESILSK